MNNESEWIWKLQELLSSIKTKKEKITILQKEIEIKIADLDKLLDEIENCKRPKTPNNAGTNSKVKSINKPQTQKS